MAIVVLSSRGDERGEVEAHNKRIVPLLHREVPSAAIGARRLAAHADFLSIGTNDLIQYLFAVDRLNGGVADIGDVLEPDVLSLIGSVIDAGHQNDAWVGVCGEASGDPTTRTGRRSASSSPCTAGPNLAHSWGSAE